MPARCSALRRDLKDFCFAVEPTRFCIFLFECDIRTVFWSRHQHSFPAKLSWWNYHWLGATTDQWLYVSKNGHVVYFCSLCRRVVTHERMDSVSYLQYVVKKKAIIKHTHKTMQIIVSKSRVHTPCVRTNACSFEHCPPIGVTRQAHSKSKE